MITCKWFVCCGMASDFCSNQLREKRKKNPHLGQEQNRKDAVPDGYKGPVAQEHRSDADRRSVPLGVCMESAWEEMGGRTWTILRSEQEDNSKGSGAGVVPGRTRGSGERKG
jgi:hypothetical protein